MAEGCRSTGAMRRAQLLVLAVAGIMVAGLLTLASAQTTTLTVLNFFSTSTQKDAFAKMVSGFEQGHPNIKIESQTVPFSSLTQRVLQASATGNAPAIATIDGPDVAQLASAGVLYDMSSDISAWGQWGDYYPGPKTEVTFNGGIYGVPIGTVNLAIFYNKQMFQAAGITDLPTTWAELSADAKKLTDSSKGVYGLAFSAANSEEGTWQWLPFLWSNGGSLEKLDAQPSVQALTYWADLVKSGSTSSGVLNWTQSDVTNQLVQGKAAMVVMGPWAIPQIKQDMGDNFGSFPIPVPKAGDKVIGPLGGEIWTMPKTTPEKEKAAWQFLQYIQQPDQVASWVEAINYLPAREAAMPTVLSNAPILKPFADEIATARSRTGPDSVPKPNLYPDVSLAVRTAIQEALTGQQTPEQALSTAAKQVAKVLGQ